jgi:hypothetical protein
VHFKWSLVWLMCPRPAELAPTGQGKLCGTFYAIRKHATI